MYLLCEEVCNFSSFVVRLVEVEMENGCQIFFFQWRLTVLSKVVLQGTCFFRPVKTIEYDISFHRKHSKLLNIENSNTPHLCSKWLKKRALLCNNFTGRISVTLIYDVFMPFLLDYDLSYLINHVFLT